MHSAAELVLWSWGDTAGPAPNQTGLRTLGRRFAFFNNYYPQQSDELYATEVSRDQQVSSGGAGVPSARRILRDAVLRVILSRRPVRAPSMDITQGIAMKRAIRHTTWRRWRAAPLAAALALAGLPLAQAAATQVATPGGPTGASTWTVTGSGEAAMPTSATCDAGAHTCPTLRDAINTALSGDTIVFDAALDNATISLTLYSNLMGCQTISATTCGDGGTLGRQFGPAAFFIDGRSITIDATALAQV